MLGAPLGGGGGAIAAPSHSHHHGMVTVLKKTKRRTTEKILQKLGASEQTPDDKEFNDLQAEFADSQKQLLLLLSKFQLYVESIEKWQKCGESLAREVAHFVETGQDHSCEARKGLEILSERFSATQEEMSSVCSNLVDQWSLQILGPLRDVALTFNHNIKDMVHDRAKDKIDFDVYRRRAKSLATPDSSKGAKMREAHKNFVKLSATQTRFEEHNAFLQEQFKRMREERSLVIIHELALAVQFQNEFTKSMHRVTKETFQDQLAEFLPEDMEGFDRRMNKWAVQGGEQTQLASGYTTKGGEVSVPGSTKMHKGGIMRSNSARHYARNAPRGKQVFLKNIGKQLTLDRKHNQKPIGTGFVLPNSEDVSDISMVSYKTNIPLEEQDAPIHLSEKREAFSGNPHEDDPKPVSSGSQSSLPSPEGDQKQEVNNQQGYHAQTSLCQSHRENYNEDIPLPISENCATASDEDDEQLEGELSAVEEEEDGSSISDPTRSGGIVRMASDRTIRSLASDDGGDGFGKHGQVPRRYQGHESKTAYSKSNPRHKIDTQVLSDDEYEDDFEDDDEYTDYKDAQDGFNYYEGVSANRGSADKRVVQVMDVDSVIDTRPGSLPNKTTTA